MTSNQKGNKKFKELGTFYSILVTVSVNNVNNFSSGNTETIISANHMQSVPPQSEHLLATRYEYRHQTPQSSL